MRAADFGGKPTGAHVLWQTNSSTDSGNTLFDERKLHTWCNKYDVDYDVKTDADHEITGGPRKQYLCTFAWQKDEQSSVGFGDEEWSIDSKQTPQTFIEIDSEGTARVKGWNAESELELEELWCDGPALVLKTAAEAEAKRLDVRRLKR
jgi:hypothetical protein